mgnify:CR=1 FL=1
MSFKIVAEDVERLKVDAIVDVASLLLSRLLIEIILI